jgi:glyoxylase-like metal-dependent hydrolase (beta-lactamase superfamily II)
MKHFLPFAFLAILPLTLAQENAAEEVDEQAVQGNVHMLAGPGGNVTVQAGKQGVLLVDTGLADVSGKTLAAVRKISTGQIRYVIDTHADADHAGGNENLRKAGKMVFAGPGAGAIRDAAEGAAVIAHENVLNRMSAPTGTKAPVPTGAWPTETYFGDQHDMFFNGESIEVIHIPNAHTDGDSMVYFRRSDVISTGDIFTLHSFPVIDLDRGGSLQGILAGLNRIIDIAIPEAAEEGGTLIIPGHGRLCDEADAAEYRDMVTIIRDRMQMMIKKGMTLDQIQAARPAFEYEPLYGSAKGWSTKQFIEAAYKSLTKK